MGIAGNLRYGWEHGTYMCLTALYYYNLGCHLLLVGCYKKLLSIYLQIYVAEFHTGK